MSAVRDFEQRHLAAWILRQKIRRAALAAQNIDLDRTIRRVQQRQCKANLVAVAGALHGIEFIHSLVLRLLSCAYLARACLEFVGLNLPAWIVPAWIAPAWIVALASSGHD